MNTFRFACTLAVAASLVQLAACGGAGGPTAAANPATKVKTPGENLRPKSFKADCTDFLSYTADALTEQYLTPQIYYLGGPTPVASPSAPATGNSGTPDRVSETNVQEAGVDEADLVKADASGRFYILRDQELLVMKAYPASGMGSAAITRVPLVSSSGGSLYAQDFFLDEANRRLVVLATGYEGSSGTAVSLVFDLANPDAPVERIRLSVSGYGLEARRIGARVHRVSRFDLPTPPWVYDSNDSLQKKREDYNAARSRNDSTAASRIKGEIRSEIGTRVQRQGAASFLPLVASRTSAGETSRTLGCDSLMRPDVTTATGLALVESFNTDGSARAVSGLVNNAFLVYASAQNLYLAQTSGGWFFAPNQADETVIYRLALSATGAAAYQGLAKVDGAVPGRYALSEYQGHLRVASNEFRSDANGNNRYTHLSIFKADAASDMAATGAVRDLAPGESLRGTRFVGPRGYLVTFRQVDPLFAFDLANPAAPQLKSALKIPGFSSYLQPLGDNYLLTVGRAGDEQQLNGQLAVQLFDVRDLAKVQLVSSFSPHVGGNSYSYSAAEYDPHAFSYFPDRADAAAPGTLSLPVQSYSDQSGQNFSGFLVLRVNPTAAAPLTELGRIDHQGFADTRTYCGGSGSGSTPPCASSVYASDPRRSVFVQDASGTALFSISTLGIKASDATAPSRELGSRQFD